VKRSTTARLGSQLSLIGAPRPTAPARRGRVRALGTDADEAGQVAVGTSPPGKVGPRRTDRPNSRVGQLVAGHEIMQRLAGGGTSVVYLARPAGTSGDAQYAIKVMRRRFAADVDMIGRFEREATLLDRVRHTGVPTIGDRGRTGDGVPYLAMDLLDGYTLGERLDEGPMSVHAIIDIAQQLADALAAVHEAGIVHCDVKPDNLFLVRDPERRSRYRAVIIDFGTAVARDTFEAKSRRIIGTPPYMAPEQCRMDGSIDERTDVYGFGCLLYEMLCGEVPFGGNMADILAAHQKADPPRAAALRPDTPATLDALIQTMLSKDPDQRPPSMAAVRACLAQTLPSRPRRD
jgi:serine/threonine protein kinase